MKEAGVLAPLFAIPNRYGIGDFSSASKRFIDYLHRIGFRYWQILPLNPVGLGNSPYQSISSFALDDIYVSLSDLKRRGLIKEVVPFSDSNPNRVDYIKVREYKLAYFKEAYLNFIKKDDAYEILDKFLSEIKGFHEYASYVCLSKINEGRPWNEWEIRKLDLKKYRNEYYYEAFKQYILLHEWDKIHAYAMSKHVLIIGDLPFYVGHNSADVYFNQKCFLLDKDGKPTLVAGVPPDYFSADGQMWGNPIYDWDYLKKNKYEFLFNRIVFNTKIYDYIRFDHFRAFDTYYTIPADAVNARIGEWKEAPGYDFFDYLLSKREDVHILAEDLGEMREEVYKLRDHYHFPGMNVVQFSIVPEEIEHQKFPEVYKRENSISYTGTHDNDTLLSWYHHLEDYPKNELINYLESRFGKNDFNTNIIKYSLSEPAKLSIISISDALNIEEGRFNEPGTMSENNWTYRITDFNTLLDKEEYLKKLIAPYINK